MTCVAKPLFCLSLALLPLYSQAQIFTCKDDAGRTISADRPIPECAHRPMREISREGWVKREIPAPLTAEQKRQLQLQDEQRKNQQAALEDQRQYDRVLMLRYSSEASIEAARRRELQLQQEKREEAARLVSSDAERRSADLSQIEAAIVQTNMRYDRALKRFRELNPATAADKKR